MCSCSFPHRPCQCSSYETVGRVTSRGEKVFVRHKLVVFIGFHDLRVQDQTVLDRSDVIHEHPTPFCTIHRHSLDYMLATFYLGTMDVIVYDISESCRIVNELAAVPFPRSFRTSNSNRPRDSGELLPRDTLPRRLVCAERSATCVVLFFRPVHPGHIRCISRRCELWLLDRADTAVIALEDGTSF